VAMADGSHAQPQTTTVRRGLPTDAPRREDRPRDGPGRTSGGDSAIQREDSRWQALTWGLDRIRWPRVAVVLIESATVGATWSDRSGGDEVIGGLPVGVQVPVEACDVVGLLERGAVYDRTADTALSPPVATALADAVLVFDGVFLMRPELIDRWDLRIFVSTALEKTVDRAMIRERRVSSRAEVERRWRERYIPSQQLYFATVRPTDHVDIIEHNDEPQQPAWETRTH
jgi:hypothetical protein